MKLGRLLAAPPIIAGAGDDAWRFLAGGVPGLDPDHPLRDAVRRLSHAGVEPRHARMTPGVGLLDLGGDSGPPNLILYLAQAGRGRPFGHVTWVSWGLERPSVNLFLGPVLTRLSSGIHEADTVEEIHDILLSKTLSESNIETDVTVEHVLTPLTYRIYPDTPIAEIQHLMLRRGLSAVPVVGASHEVLGVIAVSDILPHILPGRERGGRGGREPLSARDVMTRAVLCVSEDEPLLEASRSMIGRAVSRLPVVRGGELIGFLERGTVMRAFAEAIVAAPPPRRG